MNISLNDIDFDNKTISISKSIQRLNKEDIISAPKTPKSNRVIPITDFLSDDLKSYSSKLYDYDIKSTDRIFSFTKFFLYHEMNLGCKKSVIPVFIPHQNLLISHFSIAMYYGYDVINDSAELIIASDVFMKALSPKSKGSNEITDIIGKIMLMTELTAIKQTAKKSWSDMATRGGLSLLITQMRALANKAVQKALEKTGQKGLKESLFKGVFEQIGKKLTKNAVGKSIPFIGGIIGALFDTAQMNVILGYADIFYNKRYLLEKNIKINQLIDSYSVYNIRIDVTDGNN